MTAETAAHFRGCHSGDAEAAPNPEGYEPQKTESCWHCGTPATRGACGCADCWEGADYVPPSAVYHCPVCGRWWAHMTMRVTKITFGAAEEDR